MDYQELYSKYQNAIRLRELKADKNYTLLKDIFVKKMLSGISSSAQNFMMAYLAGIKDVFGYVDSESEKINFYRDELDKVLADK